jgi:Fic family protein
VEHIAGVPLNPSLRRRLHRLYLAKGVHATTAIEGNTLSEAQVQQAIDGSLRSMPSQEYLAQEVRNVIRMCNRIGRAIFSGRDVPITPRLIKHFNRALMHKLPKKPDCDCRAGEVSGHPVVVGNVYKGAPREDCEFLLQRLCDWLERLEIETPHLDATVLAILKAVVAHLYIAWIHPFCDGNGRTARLLELLILLKANVPSAAGHLLSNHYNETRSIYYDELAKTSRSGGNIAPFVFYAVQGLRDQLKEQISWIREQQIDAAWLQLVEEIVPGLPEAKYKRQCALIAGLGRRFVPHHELKLLTPDVAFAYAKLSNATLNRDLAELENLDLIQFDPSISSYKANIELTLGLMAKRKDSSRANLAEYPASSRRRGRPRSKSRKSAK